MDSSLTPEVAAAPFPGGSSLPQALRLVRASDPLRVLLAEDSPVVQRRLLALITELGRPIRVTPVVDGLNAAQLFDQLQPDVVILDIALPGLTGFDLLASFKLKQPACVVIMLTTYDYPEFRANALRMGADFFFCKALEFERVSEVLVALTAATPQGETDGGTNV